jgi:hypothetical protein
MSPSVWELLGKTCHSAIREITLYPKPPYVGLRPYSGCVLSHLSGPSNDAYYKLRKNASKLGHYTTGPRRMMSIHVVKEVCITSYLLMFFADPLTCCWITSTPVLVYSNEDGNNIKQKEGWNRC